MTRLHGAKPGRSKRRIHAAARSLLLPLYTVTGGALAGQLELEPYTAIRMEHDSNVFRYEDEDEAEAVSGDDQMGDTFLRAALGVDARYDWAQQRSYFKGEVSRNQYDEFSQLDFTGYDVNAGWNWRAARAIDGTFDARQTRRIESFADVNTDTRTLQTVREIDGMARFAISPRWATQLGAQNREISNDRQDGGDLEDGFDGGEDGFRENVAFVGLLYTGVDRLTAGLVGEYLKGEFFGFGTEGDYDEQTGKVTIDWKLSGISSVSGALGYTTRSSDVEGEGSTSGITGDLSYTRQISAKTTFNASLYRRVDSYDANASTVTQLGGGAGFDWRPTRKVTARLRYDYQQADFKNDQIDPTIGDDRQDDNHIASLVIDFQPRWWLIVRPGVEFDARKSNQPGGDYDDERAYLELEFRYGRSRMGQ